MRIVDSTITKIWISTTSSSFAVVSIPKGAILVHFIPWSCVISSAGSCSSFAMSSSSRNRCSSSEIRPKRPSGQRRRGHDQPLRDGPRGRLRQLGWRRSRSLLRLSAAVAALVRRSGRSGGAALQGPELRR